MDREQVELAARLAGIEAAMQLTLAIVYTTTKATPDGVDKLHRGVLDMMSRTAMKGADPAISDHLTAETTAATTRILDGAALFFRKLKNAGQ